MEHVINPGLVAASVAWSMPSCAVVPGANDSTTTSAPAASARKKSRSPSERRSRTALRLPRPQTRSPVPDEHATSSDERMPVTCAPLSASSIVVMGPAMPDERSSTRRSSKTPLIADAASQRRARCSRLASDRILTTMSNVDPEDPPRKPRRPPPIVTADSAGFWEAAAEQRLVAQRCGDCGRLRHPPRPMCPQCNSLSIELVELSGRGALYSYSVLHHPQHPAFEYPVLAALVDLEEGVRIVSNLTDVDPANIRIGMPLEVDFEAREGGTAIPVFRPRAVSQS